MVLVGTVTDDTRVYEVMTLRFTKITRARISKAAGECLTFEQLDHRDALGQNMVLLRGPKNVRELVKHFNKPYVRSKGKKFERAVGRRNSRGFRVCVICQCYGGFCRVLFWLKNFCWHRSFIFWGTKCLQRIV
uniref:Large ribosomal subunit protein uL15/eL18 domain-containing protein n=1 Tax=Nelumbo nucifera TaxID=4432 RepID=A0A822ZEP8_NELNU|nr:TPA_asm: hypothetical protein HUJ06_014401 [Nelumbo nucifera]